MSTRSLTLAEARRRVTQVESPSYDVHLDLTDPATGTFGSRSTVRFTPRAESTFLELADAAEVRVVVDGTPVAAAYDAGRIALAGLAPGVVTEVTVEARLPYVTRRRRHAHLHRPGRRRDLRVGLLRHGHRPPGLRVLRPERPEGPDRADRDGRPRLDRPRQRPADDRRRRPLGAHGHPAGAGRAVRRVRRPVALRHLGPRRAAVRLARPPVAGRGPRPRRRRAAPHHRRRPRPPGHAVHRALPVRLVRPDLRAGSQLGRPGEPGLRHLPGRDAAARAHQRPPARLPRHRHRPRAGPHVVRQPGDDALVRGHLAPGVVRRLPRLPGRRRRGRLRRRPGAPRDRPQAGGVRRRRAPLHPSGRPARRAGARRRRRAGQLRLDLLRQGQLGAPPAGDLARRRGLPGRAQPAPDPAPVRERHPGGLPRCPRRHLRPRRAGLGRGLAADGRVRHGLGRPRAATCPCWCATGSGPTASPSPRTTTGCGRVASGWSTWARHRSRWTTGPTRSWSPTRAASRSCGSASTSGRRPPWRRTSRTSRTTWCGRCCGRVCSTAPRPATSTPRRTSGWWRATSPARPTPRSWPASSTTLSARVVPLRVTADAAGAAIGRVAAACLAGLDRDPAEQTAIAFAEGLAVTSADPDLLRRWLADGRTDAGTTLDPRLRWRALGRLAQLGAADEDEIEAARTADGSAEAELGAARALAARPTAAAKEAAWLAMTDDQVSNRMFSALADGLWSAEHAELVAPYVAAYAERGPALAGPEQCVRQRGRLGLPAAGPGRGAGGDVRAGLAGRRTDPAAARLGGRARRPPLIDVRRGRRTSRSPSRPRRPP